METASSKTVHKSEGERAPLEMPAADHPCVLLEIFSYDISYFVLDEMAIPPSESPELCRRVRGWLSPWQALILPQAGPAAWAARF